MKMLFKLPSEIVREIADTTGLVKIRNGKYMTQIAKTDPRYRILSSIPKKKIIFHGDLTTENKQFEFLSTVTLFESHSKRIYLDVSGMYFKGEEYVNYNLYVVDCSNKMKRHNYHYREGCH